MDVQHGSGRMKKWVLYFSSGACVSLLLTGTFEFVCRYLKNVKVLNAFTQKLVMINIMSYFICSRPVLVNKIKAVTSGALEMNFSTIVRNTFSVCVDQYP